MTSPEDLLETAWATLSSLRAGRGVDTSPVDIQVPAGPLRAGLDGYGARHLLIPAGEDPVQDDRRSAGVVMVEQELTFNGQVERFADVVCTSPELNDVFTALAADICGSLADAPDHPLDVISGVLSRWRKLLAQASARTEFTREAAVGLQGELSILDRAVDLAGVTALDAWTGPDRLHHDFRAGDTAVEVKTTTAREGLRVEIHGIEQLDHSADVRLHLAVLRMIEDPAGSTLPEAVEALANRVNRTALMERLRGSGYRHGETPAPHGEPWPRLVDSELHLWVVGDDFPAIRRSALPAKAPVALERVRYVLNLAGAGEPCDEDEVERILTLLGSRT